MIVSPILVGILVYVILGFFITTLLREDLKPNALEWVITWLVWPLALLGRFIGR